MQAKQVFFFLEVRGDNLDNVIDCIAEQTQVFMSCYVIYM